MIVSYLNLMYSMWNVLSQPFKSLGLVRFLKKSLLCPPRLHLLELKYYFKNIIYSCDVKTEFSAEKNQVEIVTWYFKNYSSDIINMLILSSIHIYFIVIKMADNNFEW